MNIQLEEHIDLLPDIDLGQRIIGEYKGKTRGPNIVFFGGIHGKTGTPYRLY